MKYFSFLLPLVLFLGFSAPSFAFADTEYHYTISEDGTGLTFTCPESYMAGDETNSGDWLVGWSVNAADPAIDPPRTLFMSPNCNYSFDAGVYGPDPTRELVVTHSPNYTPFNPESDYPFCYDGQTTFDDCLANHGSEVMTPASEGLHAACYVTDENTGARFAYWTTDPELDMFPCTLWTPPEE